MSDKTRNESQNKCTTWDHFYSIGLLFGLLFWLPYWASIWASILASILGFYFGFHLGFHPCDSKNRRPYCIQSSPTILTTYCRWNDRKYGTKFFLSLMGKIFCFFFRKFFGEIEIGHLFCPFFKSGNTLPKKISIRCIIKN